jgi:hypothetical protein
MSLRGGSEFVGFTLRETVGPLLIGAGLLPQGGWCSYIHPNQSPCSSMRGRLSFARM